MKKFEWGISVRMAAAFVAVAVCLAVGCRRTDVRDFEVSIPKYGEAPISVSGIGDGMIDLTIRRVGRVTNEVFERYEGQRLLLRGPYPVSITAYSSLSFNDNLNTA